MATSRPPATARARNGSRGGRNAASTHSASAIVSGKWANPRPNPTVSTPATSRRMARKPPAASSAPPRPTATRAAVSAMAMAAAISSGWYSGCHCRMPRSNSSWNVERPTSTVAGIDSQSRRAGPRRSWAPASRNTSQTAIGVREAAPIIRRWVGPHIVTSMPYTACQ